MIEVATNYEMSIYALGAAGALYLVQLLIADVVGILNKHTPGTPVEADHNNLLFRVSRTVANTNESAVIFLVVLGFCLLNSADPNNVAIAAWVYVVARLAYAACYYLNIQIARSVCFGLSLLALLGLLIIGVIG